jgi:hypothetical protein
VTVVRRPGDLENGVRHAQAPSRELLLELRLEVDVARQRVLDAVLEGVDDRRTDRLEPVLEIESAEGRLEQGRDDVPVVREARELLGVDLSCGGGEPASEAEAAADDGAALPRDDVGPDLRQTSLGEVRKPLEELLCNRKPEHAVPEELQALVRVAPVLGPGGVREDVAEPLLREPVDERCQVAVRGRHRAGATGALGCSRPPGRRW